MRFDKGDMGREPYDRFLDHPYSARPAREDDAVETHSVITTYDVHIAG
jgi:hypothetical protein